MTSSYNLLDIPEDKMELMDFRWISKSHKISVGDDMLYMGIPAEAKNKKGARVLVEWFFRPETQRNLLEINQSKNFKIFGVANGFSSLRIINEREIPHYYSLFLNHMPSEENLLFPEILPPFWDVVKGEVIENWILQEMSAATEEGGEIKQSFKEYFDGWKDKNNLF